MNLIASGETLQSVRIEITPDEFLAIMNEQLKNQSLMVLMEESGWVLPTMKDVEIVERRTPVQVASGSSPEKPAEQRLLVISGTATRPLPQSMIQMFEYKDKFQPNITIVRREDDEDFRNEL